MTSGLNDLLKATSRSFYLTLRVLPAAIRSQIGLAYLLARTTDTIADTEVLPVTQRLEALQRLRGRILKTNDLRLNFGELASHQGLPEEKILLERVEEALAALERLTPADQQLIRDVLEIITSGQELDLERFRDASEENIIALGDATDLDDYTFRVAGCVGEFWTKICRAHLFPQAKIDEQRLLLRGVRFGKGLQLVNILRDLPRDLRQGRCYLPADELANAGLKPADLLYPGNEARVRVIYNFWLNTAEEHLAAGWDYTASLPRGCARVRLGCAWPILIGARTLKLLRTGNMLDPQQRLKVSRAEVKGILLQSVLYYPFRSYWLKLFDAHRN